MNLWRNIIIMNATEGGGGEPTEYPLPDEPVNHETPYPIEPLTPFTPDPRFIIVGAKTIDGDVRAGVYSILDKQTMTLVSERSTSTANISGGYTIAWSVNSLNLLCSTTAYNERMHLDILRNIQNADVRVSATINGNGITDKTVYFDVNCSYAPANFVIRKLDDWLLLKNAIDTGTESQWYKNATAGCANKRFRLGANLTFNYDVANYMVGRFNNNTKGVKCFKGTFDGADNTITLSGTNSYKLSTDRNGGVFGYVHSATIKNLNVTGSFTSNMICGGVIGTNTRSYVERVYANLDITCVTPPSGYTGSLTASGVWYAGTYISNNDTRSNFAGWMQDVMFVGHVKAKNNSALLSTNECTNAHRVIAIGKAESTNYSNPVKSGFTITDAVKSGNHDIYLEGFFSKANLINGADYLRGCLQVPADTYPYYIQRILDLNKPAADTCTVFSVNRTTTLTNCYTRQSGSTSYQDSAWFYNFGTNISFANACQTDYFDNHSDWIKGSVGTNVLNNQYATYDEVLSAAKNEDYYGGY